MAQMRRCPSCGKEVASNAWKCPHCGHSFTGEKVSVNMNAGCLTALLVGLGVFVLLLICMAVSGN